MQKKPAVKMRSRRGCLVCRRRKVKCDERHPACSRCVRLNLTCEWQEAESAAGASPLQRSRQSQACQRCSERRMRCEPCTESQHSGASLLLQSTAESCRACYHARVQCIKRGPRPHHELQSEAQTEFNARASGLPVPAEIDRLIDAYFRGPHHFCFYSFIHPETFRRLHAHGRIPMPLLLAVLATTLQCIDPENPLADEWARRSRKLVMDDTFSRMSALNLQTILLLARHQWHVSAHSSASLLAALAHRMAYDLQLNREPRGERERDNRSTGNAACSSRLPELILETRRRLMWSTFVVEDLPDAGGHQPTLPSVSIDPRSIGVLFPSGDHKYMWKTSTEDAPPADISSVMMPLLIIRRRIIRYSIAYHPRNETAGPELECPWHSGSGFASLLADLESWAHSMLPPELYFNEENLLRNKSCLTAFLTLHCTFHVVYTDLFGIGYFLRRRMAEGKASLVLGDSRAPKNFLEYCDIERRKHASRILDILLRTKTHPHLHYQRDQKQQQQQQDPFVAICTGVAFRILCLEPALKEDAAPWLWPTQQHIDVAFECIGLSARWSRPIRRLLVALAQAAAKKGIHTEYAIDTRNMRNNPPSCPASPTMRHLGTEATIKSYLTASDRELLPPDADAETTESIQTKPWPNTQSAPEAVSAPAPPLPTATPTAAPAYPSSSPLDHSTTLPAQQRFENSLHSQGHPQPQSPNPNPPPALYDTTTIPTATAPDATTTTDLSPTAQEMLDFWWTDGPAGVTPERVECPDLFDLNMWLDFDGFMSGQGMTTNF